MICLKLIASSIPLLVFSCTIPFYASQAQDGKSAAEEATDICIRINSLVAEDRGGSIQINDGEIRVNKSGKVAIYRGDRVLEKGEFDFESQVNCVEKFLKILVRREGKLDGSDAYEFFKLGEYLMQVTTGSFCVPWNLDEFSKYIRRTAKPDLSDLKTPPEFGSIDFEVLRISEIQRRVSLLGFIRARASSLGLSPDNANPEMLVMFPAAVPAALPTPEIGEGIVNHYLGQISNSVMRDFFDMGISMFWVNKSYINMIKIGELYYSNEGNIHKVENYIGNMGGIMDCLLNAYRGSKDRLMHLAGLYSVDLHGRFFDVGKVDFRNSNKGKKIRTLPIDPQFVERAIREAF